MKRRDVVACIRSSCMSGHNPWLKSLTGEISSCIVHRFVSTDNSCLCAWCTRHLHHHFVIQDVFREGIHSGSCHWMVIGNKIATNQVAVPLAVKRAKCKGGFDF